MGTYRNPGSTPGVSIAGEISTGISEISQTGRKKRDLVNKFQKEALEEKRKQQDLIDQLEDVDEKNPINSMLEGFNGRVDEAYNMKLKSFGGDTSEYDKHYQDTQKILEDIIPATGIIDKTIEDFNKMSPSERNKAILRSPFVGEDADKRNKYKALLEDPSKMGYKFKGDKIIITYDNEELFNASALINATKKGFSLLEKATDYSPELKIVGDEAYENLANLKTIKSIETKDKNIITAEEKVLYSDAIEEFERRLRAEENSKLQALVNESNYQRFITSDDVFDVNKDGKETKEAIIAYLVKNKFPQGEDFISKTQQKEDYLTKAQEEKLKQSKRRLNISERSQAVSEEKLKLQKLELEKEKRDPSVEYVVDIGGKLKTAAETNDVNTVKEIIKTQLASTSGFNPDKIEVKDGKITIQSDKVEEKTYSPEQIKEINTISQEKIGKDIISNDGFIVDKDNFEQLLKENPNLATPKGRLKTKASDIFVINDWTSPTGLSELTTIMVDKKFTKSKTQAATRTINEIYDVGKKVETAATTEDRRIETIDNIKKDIENFYKSSDPKGQFNYYRGRGKDVVNMIKGLPERYTIKLYGDEINPLEYIESNKATNKDVYDGIVRTILDDAKTNPELKNIDLSISKYISDKGGKKRLDP